MRGKLVGLGVAVACALGGSGMSTVSGQTPTIPSAPTLFRQSVAAMRVLHAMHGDGSQAEYAPSPPSLLSYHIAGDCTAQRKAAVTLFTLTGSQTFPRASIRAQFTMTFPYGHGDTHTWKRALRKKAPWNQDDQDHTALVGAFLCPFTLIQQLQASYPAHLRNLGAQRMDGRPCWHLRSDDPSTVEPGIVTISDFYLDRSSLRWIRVVQVRGLAPNPPTTPGHGYSKTDFHYSGFDEAVKIAVP